MTLFEVILKTIFSNNYVYNTVFFSTAIIEKVQCHITIYPASSFITFPPFPSFGIFSQYFLIAIIYPVSINHLNHKRQNFLFQGIMIFYLLP